MQQRDGRDQQIARLGDRLSRLSSASLRINESLDLDEVLQGVVDSARALTNARYALITTLDDSGQAESFVGSGLTPDELQQLWEMPDGLRLYEYLSAIPGPQRALDLASYISSMGFPDFRVPVPVSSFLAVPIRYQGVNVGNINLGKETPGEEFSQEDEEILVMFAAQVALVVANARRHREERRARADLETLINTSPVGVLVFDMRADVPISINREVERIVESLAGPDHTAEQLLELMTVRRADGRELSLAEFPVTQALSSGETVRAEEMVLEVPQGHSVTVLVNSTPLRSEDGEVESVVITIQDMTPLEEIERLRSEFLGMVSHELRTPLTSIRGSATTMLDATSDLDPTEMRQFLRIIVDQADSMRELIGNLLDVARIETGTLPVSPEPADVAVLVDRARSNFISAGGVNRLDIDIAPDLPLAMVDRRRIVQVISNLISNAARHSPESSAIRVIAARREFFVEVSVIDEGRGIPADHLPQLFRKFSRVEAEDPEGDTGLGLAICKGIVEAHGGRIWAENAGPGLGARFAFTVPAAEEVATPLREPDLNAPRVEQGGQPVLVVDDDPQALRYVRRTLTDAGYAPIVCADPDEVLSLVQETRPYLVLLDLMLPGTDGIELMGDIFTIADVPVIFISAYGRDRVVARAFEMGATDFIVKPFSPTELVARVRAALRRRTGSGQPEPSEPYEFGDLKIDYLERRVTVAGQPVRLTATEYKLIHELSSNAGRVLTHDQLLRRVWGPNRPGDLRALRTHLRRLRRKLGEDASDPTYFFSEPRVGYRMAKGDSGDES